jgi:Putative addiction module component
MTKAGGLRKQLKRMSGSVRLEIDVIGALRWHDLEGILWCMSKIAELEKEILALPAVERERIAIVAWESLLSDSKAASNREIDPEGIQLAEQRDKEIESGKVKAIDHAEFLRRTGGKTE